MEDIIDKLVNLVKRKMALDEHTNWVSSSAVYMNELRGELEEVNDEIVSNRLCFLEDELGDILWDYINIIMCLEQEKGITLDSVIKRVFSKYDERISGLESGQTWKEIKNKQKLRLEQEYSSKK
ncbi:MazG nucleotide pyrophosphohydrolase domain-containing protein [Spirochaeta cellobiosiphila]|uniref:MazG nucleotide pyrophosphohydrolase domain-containing protein n=1 Tax=Spirochaeta cellobiosiphila TaxID=504483 RepID=UPI00040CEB30|nr:MazG nucleotide pyrophosphohydrolase domain-containing protein [Spirochaeta cellobiosiphila]